MFTIKHENNNNNYDYNNSVFSNAVSRPSKSLINCDLYKEFSKIYTNLEILNEFSCINNQSKKKEYFLLKEIINIFKLNSLDTDNFSISYDSIIINEIINENNLVINIIFCFDNDVSLRNIVINLLTLIKELQNKDCLLINFDNLFTFPSSELLVIISNLFSKVKIYYCKLLKQNILYCYNYKNNKHITVFLKNIIKNWNKNSNIRQFGIFIDEFLLKKIKNHNNFIFDYYIKLNNNFANSTLEEKEYYFKNYIKKNSKLINHCLDCNHEIKEFNLFNCYICNKCYDLFMIYL
jgi:hypothetical protein